MPNTLQRCTPVLLNLCCFFFSRFATFSFYIFRLVYNAAFFVIENSTQRIIIIGLGKLGFIFLFFATNDTTMHSQTVLCFDSIYLDTSLLDF